MAGWNLKSGIIKEMNVSEDHIWSLFNYVFSDSCSKRNTYKYGLIKALVDNAFGGKTTPEGIYYTYEELFDRFTNNYWNLIAKYNLKQMRRDGRSEVSKIEKIINKIIEENGVLSILEYDSIPDSIRASLVKRVAGECKKNVIGALYEDFDGLIYSFDLNGSGILLNHCVHTFILRYKMEIERLNYYSWARFLEKVNSDNVLVRVLDKLETATPRRSNLSIYREILRREFEEDNCFYCGAKLRNKIHVDHFIPWSFVKDDKIWNFVLSCSNCNERKNNKLPKKDYIVRMEVRNKKMRKINDPIVQMDFEGYTDDLISRIWMYARIGGLKEFTH